jgi:tripartite-type tricarboxylate transporter receptor subunit TctC
MLLLSFPLHRRHLIATARWGAALLGLTISGAVLIAARPAAAQADFYKGKTVEIIISTGVTGGLDANARVVARHLGNHLPGHPTIVPKNMPGGGHIRAANYVFGQAPKDGTTIGTFIPIFVTAQVLDRSSGIHFDAAEFQWLISTSSSNSTVYAWHTAPVNSLEDAMKREVVLGGTGVGSYTVIYPTVMNSVIGTKFKLVTGYQGTGDIALAMQRGEVEGRAGNNFNSLKAESPDWLPTGKIRLLAQVGLERDPEHPTVPLLLDFARNDEDRQILRLFSSDVVIGRPFAVPPGVPAERVALLRKAFEEMMRDPAYIEEANRSGLDLSPVSGERVQQLITELVHSPPAIVAKAKLAMEPKGMVERGK